MDSTFILERECSICGKKIEVKLDKTGKILNCHVYFGTMRFGIGNWVYGRLEKDQGGKTKIVKVVSLHKEIFYRLRDIYRRIFHKYVDVEYWECKTCYEKGLAKNET